MSSISDFLFGSSDKLKKVNNFDSQQGQLHNSILSQLLQMQGQGGGYSNALQILQDYLNPQSDAYQNFEQPYLDQFNQQTIPGLAEQFAGAGGGMGGGLSSSGFGQALGAAGANLQTNLAQMKSGLQRQSVNDLFAQFNQQSQQGLNAQPFSYKQQQGSQGLLQSGLNAFLGGLGGGFNPMSMLGGLSGGQR